MKIKLQELKYWYVDRTVDRLLWRIAHNLPTKIKVYSLALVASGVSRNDNPIDADKISYARMYKYLEGKNE